MTTTPTTHPTTSLTSSTGSNASDASVSAGDQLTVVAWRDAVVEQSPGAIPTASDEALVWYLPIVGSIGTVMAHRLARYAADESSIWTIEDIARTFGMGGSTQRVLRTLERLERFGIICRQHATVAVRLWLPPLTYRQRCQLPAYLAAAYDAR
jgi:hypothetical protein